MAKDYLRPGQHFTNDSTTVIHIRWGWEELLRSFVEGTISLGKDNQQG